MGQKSTNIKQHSVIPYFHDCATQTAEQNEDPHKPSIDNENRILYPNPNEVSIVHAEAYVEGGVSVVAAHYVADVSNFTTAHKNYEGNGRLRNSDGIFAAWRPADWMIANEKVKETFALNSNGVVTVKKPGLYFIYAQIHYLDEHDINGYTVQVNNDTFLQCTTMTETHYGGSKSNTCYTGAMNVLKAGDRILIKDIETNRYSIFKPEKSFFGLVRMASLPDNEFKGE